MNNQQSSGTPRAETRELQQQPNVSFLQQIEAQNVRAAEDTKRFARKSRNEQIKYFQIPLLQLRGMLNCYGQGEVLAERRAAFLQLVNFGFQFNRRLQVLRASGIRDEEITS